MVITTLRDYDQAAKHWGTVDQAFQSILKHFENILATYQELSDWIKAQAGR